MTNLEITLLVITAIAVVSLVHAWAKVKSMTILKQHRFMFNPSHVGRRVACTRQGEGVIKEFKTEYISNVFPLIIKYDHGRIMSYTDEGCLSSFSEPTITLIK